MYDILLDKYHKNYCLWPKKSKIFLKLIYLFWILKIIFLKNVVSEYTPPPPTLAVLD